MITLPVHDYPTRSASGFLMRYVMPRSAPPQLLGPLDRKELFRMQAIGDTIIGVGHGAPDAYAGHNDQIMMTVDSLPNLKNKVVILLSCETAQQLGPAIVEAGAAGYIGWKEDFVWIMDIDQATTPWTDEWAQPTIIPVVNCMNSVLDGKTIGAAYNKMLEEFEQNLAEEDEEMIADCLAFNRKNAVMLGDENAKIRPTPKIKLPIPPPPIILPISS